MQCENGVNPSDSSSKQMCCPVFLCARMKGKCQLKTKCKGYCIYSSAFLALWVWLGFLAMSAPHHQVSPLTFFFTIFKFVRLIVFLFFSFSFLFFFFFCSSISTFLFCVLLLCLFIHSLRQTVVFPWLTWLNGAWVIHSILFFFLAGASSEIRSD